MWWSKMSGAEKNNGVAATACIIFQPQLSQACPASAPTANNIPIAFSDKHRVVEVNIKIGEKDCRLKLLAASYDVLFKLLEKQKLKEVVQK
jgi:hypothetical protein